MASVGVWSPRYVAVSMDRTVVEVDGRFSRRRLRATTVMPKVEYEPVRDCVFEGLKIRVRQGGRIMADRTRERKKISDAVLDELLVELRIPVRERTGCGSHRSPLRS